MLELYVGPMFAGKTTTLVLECERDKYRDMQVAIIKYAADNRYSVTEVITHGGITAGVTIFTCSDLTKVDISKYDTVGIDEIQFYDNYEIVVEWAKTKRVLCAGLNGDVKMNPFPALTFLYSHADHINFKSAVCALCKQDAIYSELINAVPAVDSSSPGSNVIEIGGADKYIPVCRKCKK